MLIGTTFYPCGTSPANCNAVVRVVFDERRANTAALADETRPFPEPEGGFDPTGGTGDDTPPTHPTPPDPPEYPTTPDVGEDETDEEFRDDN